jgi:hypothetical protein
LVANHLEVKAADDAARFEALKKIVNDKHPELFLELDNGFMEWAEGGNRMPPFLDFRANADGNYQKWLEAGDVVVGSGPKAGTMWLNISYFCFVVEDGMILISCSTLCRIWTLYGFQEKHLKIEWSEMKLPRQDSETNLVSPPVSMQHMAILHCLKGYVKLRCPTLTQM